MATEWLVEARDDGTCLVRMVMSGFGTEAGWDELTGALGLAGAGAGRRFAAGPGAPDLAGEVLRAGDDAYGRSLLLRLERPGPGLAELFVLGQAGLLGLQVRLFGGDREELAARLQPAWEAWLRARFPAPADPEAD